MMRTLFQNGRNGRPEAGPPAETLLRAVKRFAEEPTPPALLSEAELQLALSLAAPFTAWLHEIQESALDALLAGRTVPGWKAVEGRASRQFTDPDAVRAALLADGIPEALFSERRLLSPAQLEKKLGTAAFHRCAAPYVGKAAGKPVLAPENDPRKPYPVPAGAGE